MAEKTATRNSAPTVDLNSPPSTRGRGGAPNTVEQIIRFEVQTGKTLRDGLIDLLGRHDSISEAAREFGVGSMVLRRLMGMVGIRSVRSFVADPLHENTATMSATDAAAQVSAERNGTPPEGLSDANLDDLDNI